MAHAVHSRTSYSNATPFGVIFLQPGFCGVPAGEDLEVADVANILARVDVDHPDCCHRITAEGQDGHSLPSQFSLLPNLSQALLQAFKLRTDLRFHGVL
jgi:hypothetical protein